VSDASASRENADDREIAYKLRLQHFRPGPLSGPPRALPLGRGGEPFCLREAKREKRARIVPRVPLSKSYARVESRS